MEHALPTPWRRPPGSSRLISDVTPGTSIPLVISLSYPFAATNSNVVSGPISGSWDSAYGITEPESGWEDAHHK